MSKDRRRKSRERAKSVRTSVSIPQELHEEVERIAARQQVSVAWVIRQAVKKFVEAERPLFAERGL